MAYGTTLARGARVVVSRDANPAARMIKRSLISGLAATGVNVSDLRVAMPAVNRHELKIDERAGGLHVHISPDDPELIQIRFFESPGILVSEATLKSIERAYSRQEFRRVSATEIGRLTYPSRATETYAQDLVETLDVDAIRQRRFRLVLDYAFSPASLVVPSMIGALAVELIGLNAFVDAGEMPRAKPPGQPGRDGAGGAGGGRRPGRAAGRRSRADLAGGRAGHRHRRRDDAAAAACASCPSR